MEDEGALCVPGYESSGTQISLTLLDNTEFDTPANVTSVSLVAADRIKIDSAWVLPIDDWAEVVVGAPFDPAARPFASAARVARDGTSVVPAGERRGLVTVLRADRGGEAERLRVEYSSGGVEYFAEGAHALRVTAADEECPE